MSRFFLSTGHFSTLCLRHRHISTRSFPSGLFTKVAAVAFDPMREHGIRNLNYLDGWLILTHSRDQLCEHRDMVLSHLSQLGLRVNWEKSKLTPVQMISFNGRELDSVNLMAHLREMCSVSAELLEISQGQDGGPAETI